MPEGSIGGMARASSDIFAADFKDTPYWWEAAPRSPAVPEAPPKVADVAIVGSGLTGLNAAIDLARAGRSVVVLDSEDLGHGASTRNAGCVGQTLKHSFRDLEKGYGTDYAIAVYREMKAAFDSVAERVEAEQIDCGFKVCGRLILTRAQRQYDDLAGELEARRKHLGTEFSMIPKSAVRDEIASDLYGGGAIVPGLGSIHPGLYHKGLLDRARSAGVTLIGRTPVTGIAGDGNGFEVTTTQGTCRAREVLVATNGYTGALLPWLRRRIIPFDAYMIATEPLQPSLMAQLLPTDRTYLDHVHDVITIRRSPDGTRILFLWRTGTRPSTARKKSAQLHADVTRIIPEVGKLKVTHSWTGRCAGTFNLWPHLLKRDGIHFAGGYCFAGLPMGTYLGRKAAQRILGKPEARTIFADRSFPLIPGHVGNPWFMPIVMRWYGLADRWQSR
ncbi:MAG: FAD-dependent oxidoreductase [Alphaproteobacteria bacterium]